MICWCKRFFSQFSLYQVAEGGGAKGDEAKCMLLRSKLHIGVWMLLSLFAANRGTVFIEALLGENDEHFFLR